jgi:alcohol dehydrogenase (cytochrome c)
MLWANRNGMMYALDRITGQFLYAKPFVQVNWLTGFDEKGRPIQAPTRPASDAVTYPGLSATNWYPPSYSPTTGLFYVPSWDRGTVDGQVPRPSPGVGALRAFDPKTGNGVWQFERKDAIFTAGALSTASGIVFTGVAGDYYSGELASNRTDRYFYALDAHTGQLLWQTALTGSLHSGPMTYSVNGKQFVSVAAGNTLFAFALRD